MSIKKLATASAIVLATFAVAPQFAYAAHDAASLKALDPDSDGTVSLDEAKAAAAKKFEMLDPDKDGTIDKKEAKGVLSAAGFKTADPDKDGTIDKAEYMAAVEAAFKKADPDGDGTLDAKELKTPAGKTLLKIIE